MVEIGRKKRTEEEVFLKGKFKWMKHIAPDFQFEPDGKWSTVLYLDGEELEKARKLQGQGIKNVIKNDDDGWYITLSRKCSYEVRGKKVGREPPKVFRMEGDKEIPITGLVGNGSDGIAKCILWSSPNFPGKNLRWEAARVDNLVEFSTEKDYPDGGESLKTLKKQEPEMLF
jgi:hypothetical protein